MIRWLVVAWVAFLAASETVTAAESQTTLRGSCMGTTYAVTIADKPAEISQDAIAQRVGDELERIEKVFSLYRSDSELSQLNAAASGEWISVSEDLLTVAKRAIEFAQETDGAFDPTVGPLMRLWRLRQIGSGWAPPTEAAIAETRERVGWRLVKLRSDPPGIFKLMSGVELDLNALVEGWAIDRVSSILVQNDIRNALIELGGEFRGMGGRPDGQPWRIGIENLQAANSLYATVALENMALSTSGDYRQAFEHNGRRYSHILDARTGKPIQHDLAAVSVVASDAMMADGWATALMVLGPTDGLALAEKKRLTTSFCLRSGATEGNGHKIILTTTAAGRIALVPSR